MTMLYRRRCFVSHHFLTFAGSSFKYGFIFSCFISLSEPIIQISSVKSSFFQHAARYLHGGSSAARGRSLLPWGMVSNKSATR